MTTNSWLVDIEVDHLNLAGYNDFIVGFTNALDAIGIVRSSDTGQFEIGAVTTVPSANSPPVQNEIRYLNDRLHATAPIYVKIGYGIAGNGYGPRVFYTFGTGTNGSGQLTGVFVPETNFSFSISRNPRYSLKSYSCAVDGIAWLMYGEGYAQNSNLASTDTNGFGIAIFRTTDELGIANGDGCAVYFHRGNVNGFNATTVSFKEAWSSAIATDASATVGNNGSYAPRVLGQSESVTGDLQKQVIPHILPFPEVTVMHQICSLLPNDNIGSGTEFQAAIKGTELRNYIAVHGFRNRAHEVIGLIWE